MTRESKVSPTNKLAINEANALKSNRVRAAALSLALAVMLPISSYANSPTENISTVSIKVENIKKAEGTVWALLCVEEEYGKGPCTYQEGAPAVEGSLTFAFSDIPAGTYGATIMHDRNDNKKLDFHWYGPPKEGYGSSNNPPPRMGPARWDDIAFAVGDKPVAMTITLKN